MACDTNSSRLAKLGGQISGAISQLSSKQAFFAGMAVGASGTGLGTLLVAKRQRMANFFQKGQNKTGPVRAAITKPKPKPIPGLSAASPAKPKPKPIPGLSPGSSPSKPKPIPGLQQRNSLPTLRAEPQDEALSNAPQTKLQAGSVQVLGRDGQSVALPNSYRVVRPDGSDTGLAVTPHLAQSDNGQANKEKGDSWSVTHTGTGALIDGPFQSIAQAQGLATALSPLRWTAATVPKADVNQAKQIINAYRESVVKEG